MVTPPDSHPVLSDLADLQTTAFTPTSHTSGLAVQYTDLIHLFNPIWF